MGTCDGHQPMACVAPARRMLLNRERATSAVQLAGPNITLKKPKLTGVASKSPPPVPFLTSYGMQRITQRVMPGSG